ncbi:MAG: hypothetical protein V4671_31300, partial [Armatimonadota bacterium]
MATHDIPQTDWETYLAAFTERHQGALVTIEDVDPMTSPTVEAGDLVFTAIRYKAQGNDGGVIELVTTSGENSQEKTHTIPAPKAVFHKPGAGVLSSEVNPDEV